MPAEVTAQREMAAVRQESLRIEHSRVPLAPPTSDVGSDAGKFPGGLVPKALPARRLGGRLRTRRR